MMIKGEDIPYMGEWADLKKNYLLEEKPEDYDELEREHMLIEYLTGIEAAYGKRFDELVQRQMEFEGVNEEMKIKDQNEILLTPSRMAIIKNVEDNIVGKEMEKL